MDRVSACLSKTGWIYGFGDIWDDFLLRIYSWSGTLKVHRKNKHISRTIQVQIWMLRNQW